MGRRRVSAARGCGRLNLAPSYLFGGSPPCGAPCPTAFIAIAERLPCGRAAHDAGHSRHASGAIEALPSLGSAPGRTAAPAIHRSEIRELNRVPPIISGLFHPDLRTLVAASTQNSPDARSNGAAISWRGTHGSGLQSPPR